MQTGDPGLKSVEALMVASSAVGSVSLCKAVAAANGVLVAVALQSTAADSMLSLVAASAVTSAPGCASGPRSSVPLPPIPPAHLTRKCDLGAKMMRSCAS
jgi:hypothetical protein